MPGSLFVRRKGAWHRSHRTAGANDLTDRKNLAIVIAAAGAGRRFGDDKMSAEIGNRTVLEISVEHLREALPGAPVIVVVARAEIERWRSIITGVEFVPGGRRRQDSVRTGIDRAVELGADVVVVHDAARPAVHAEDIRRVTDAADGVDGAILCTRPVDTVKAVDSADLVIETLSRGVLRLAQTPQVFDVAALEHAWIAQGSEPEWSDESALLEECGFSVRAVEAHHPNPKLTLRSDLELIRVLVENRR